MKQRLRRPLPLLAAALLLLGIGTGLAGTVPAAQAAVEPVAAVGTGVDEFRFASFDADYLLGRDAEGRSTLETTETLVAVFPEFDQNRGIRRAIPLRYDGHPTDLVVQGVTDENGVPRPYESEEDEDGEFLIVTIAADGYVHGAQSYVIRYSQQNITLEPDDGTQQEFYRDVNGVGWAQPFDRVGATLRMDAELVAALNGQMACYRGPQGSSQPCEQIVLAESAPPSDPPRVVAEASGLGAYENLTMAVGFEPGTFVPRDGSLAASPSGIAGVGAALATLGVFAAAVITRRRRWRDAPGRGIVIAEYEPPAGVDVLLAAELLGREKKGVTAAILDLAVGRALRVIELKKSRFQLELVDPDAASGPLRPVLTAIFGESLRPGERHTLGTTSNSIGTKLHAVTAATRKRSRAAGFRRRADAGRRVLLVAAALCGAVLTVVLSAIALESDRGGLWPLAAILVAGLAAVLTAIWLADIRPLTAQGALAVEHLRGLELFIRLAEADRLRMLQSPSGALRDAVPGVQGGRPAGGPSDAQVLRLHEKLLPYAALFGQEKEWAAALASLYAQSGEPDWYQGRSGFNLAAFAVGVSSFSTASSSSWSSSSSSSSSGGSGGGGFSGGGGGGGGGGGV
ncbi:DUF2207 family protein [Microterricola viridarii]|nr:DUF2207 domain-containing protein [Microterricola viridarii]